VNPKTRQMTRVATRAFALTSVLRQLGKARQDGDKLRVFDAAVNALAIVTAVIILVRELREQGGDVEEAVEEAPL
jgi:hypothetical protein